MKIYRDGGGGKIDIFFAPLLYPLRNKTLARLLIKAKQILLFSSLHLFPKNTQMFSKYSFPTQM